MKVIDILKQKHTVLANVSGWLEHQSLKDWPQMDVPLYHILTSLSNMFKYRIDELRSSKYHSDEYNSIKGTLPVWFVGGTFPFMHTEDKDIVSYSNILCIDIDAQEIDRDAIMELPYVFAVLRSSGGRGYYVLILVEDGKYTKEYYSYLAKLFNKKFNVNVDEFCSNIGRKRILSYDDDILNYIKPFDMDIVPWKLRDIYKPVEEKKESTLITYKPSQQATAGLTSKAIWKLLDNGYSIDDMHVLLPYAAWYHVACEFKHFDDGEDMFIRFSQNSSKYHDSLDKIKNKYKEAKTELSIDEVTRKWCGICKNRFGCQWWK